MSEFAEQVQPSGSTLAPDPHRPIYHFTPPRNWMNDPNGLIHWRGRYHLFYQHNPFGAFWGSMHWGHAVSGDLVHWQHLPIALAPTPGGPDEDGCFSGCAIDHNGVPTIIYTGVRGENQLPCLATSMDDDLVTWEKHPGNPIIPAPPDVDGLVIFRDHTVWNEGGTWYQAIGSGFDDEGGAALLYRSEDLLSWQYLHPLAVGDKDSREPFWTGLGWECPDFFALGDRYALLVSAWDGKGHYVASFTGEYRDHKLDITHQGLIDGGWSYYAPQKLIDSAGRRVLIGWLREERPVDQQVAAGWSGAMSLPRILTMRPDGTLGMRPAPEVDALRSDERTVPAQDLETGLDVPLDGVAGDCLELELTLDPGSAASVGLHVRSSPDGTERTTIRFNREAGELVLDATASSTNGETVSEDRVHRIALPLDGESLSLRVFLDRSVVEVFANERACLTARIYPERPDSTGIALFAEDGAARLLGLRAWDMSPR